MKYIGIAEAAYLLGVCRQRVQQLLYVGRIKGAFKEGRYWRIPLFNGKIPQIIPGKRGPKGTWRKRPQQAKTYIHVNTKIIQANRKKVDKDPVICVRQGNRVKYCHKVDILGGLCRVVYDPNHPQSCGATVWIEVNPVVAELIGKSNPLITQSFATSFA
jgi:hypothetical protein